MLAGVTIGTYQTASVEHDVQTELIDVFADRRPVVTVLVERPPSESESPALAETVRDRLRQATDTDPRVTVEVVDTRYSERPIESDSPGHPKLLITIRVTNRL